MKKSLQSNIWKFTVFLIANKRVFAAILGAYYLTLPGVGVEQIGYILLAGSIAGFVLEIPSGYISDKLGHKQALVFSRVCALASTLFFLFANTLTALVLGGIFLSIANAFLSGTGAAFIHETLSGLKREKEYAEVMGKIRSIGFAIPIIFMALVPFLVEISFRLPFVVGLLFDIVGIAVAISFIVPKVTQKHIDEISATNFIDVMKEGKRLKFIRIVLFTGFMAGIAATVSRYRAVYQFALDVPVIYYGVFLGVGRAMIALLLLYSGKLKKVISYHAYLGIRAFLFFLLISILGITSQAWVVVVVFVLINILTFGFGTLNNSFMLDIIRKSKFKATLLSLKPQLEVLVIGTGSFLLGFSIDRLGYNVSFFLFAGALLVFLIPQYLYIIRNKR